MGYSWLIALWEGDMNKFKALLLMLAVCLSASAWGQQDLADPKMLAEGGRLYDKWWQEYRLSKPDSTHPAYPANSKKKGSSTWRCKECHGWDYKGVAGAYGRGSHYTGIRGINRYAGKDSSEILAILKNNIHGYDDVMNDYGLKRIALFVSQGQIDISKHLESGSKKVLADASPGAPIYKEWCANCHGKDGRKINFKDDDNPEYLGTVAVKNPWEGIHKIRYGHPGAFLRGKRMPHMFDKISLEEQLSLLAYLQTFPVK